MASMNTLSLRGRTSRAARAFVHDATPISSVLGVSLLNVARCSPFPLLILRSRPRLLKLLDGSVGLPSLKAATREDDNRDDAGVIKDMEVYLDDLSMEYDSVWDTKPTWCQPWTIVSSGVLVIVASWIVLHNVFISGGAAFFIAVWWYSFLLVYPRAYTDMIAERRKMIEDGSEDLYGRNQDD